MFSGGGDSTTLLYDLIDQGKEVYALSFDYGQKHKIELTYAKRTTDKLNVSHKIININEISNLLISSALIGDNVILPQTSYKKDNIGITEVPFRNTLFLSIAAQFAYSIDACCVYYAAHAGDHELYPDCRIDYFQNMKLAIELGSTKNITLLAPYIKLSKSDIIQKGIKLGIDYADTWTCYSGEKTDCNCATCIERKDAFKKLNMEDIKH